MSWKTGFSSWRQWYKVGFILGFLLFG